MQLSPFETRFDSSMCTGEGWSSGNVALLRLFRTCNGGRGLEKLRGIDGGNAVSVMDWSEGDGGCV